MIAKIRLDRKTKTIKVVNRRLNVKLNHVKGHNIRLTHSGKKGPKGDTGDPGVYIDPNAPDNTEVIWVDTDDEFHMGLPAGGSQGQVVAKVSNDDFDTEWISLSEIVSEWGDLTGNLSDQTDLKNALDSKADLTDLESYPTNTQLTNQLATKANLVHNHTASQVTDFDTEVANNTDVTANTSARHTHSNKALLDSYTQTESDLADAVAKAHDPVDISGKQDTLISGTNIKTINGTDILGSGDLDVGGAVESVNGEVGEVVLDHSDVGADAAGSAAQALVDANNYTDTEIAGLSTGVESVTGGTNVTVDNTDPANPIISATGGGGDVESVNGQTGVVELDIPAPVYDIVVDSSGGGDYDDITTALTAATDDQRILIKPGTYTISANISPSALGLKIHGAGRESTVIVLGEYILTLSGDHTEVMGISFTITDGYLKIENGPTPNHGSIIEDCEFLCTPTTTYKRALWLEHQYSHLNRCDVILTNGKANWLGAVIAGVGSAVRDSYFEGSTAGSSDAYLLSAGDVNGCLFNSTSSVNSGAMLRLVGSGEDYPPKAIGCSFTSVGTSAAAMITASRKSLIADCSFKGFKTSISGLQEMSTVNNNVFHGRNTSGAIDVIVSGELCAISGNTFGNPSGSLSNVTGIKLNSDNNTVIGNTFRGLAKAIELGAGSDQNTIVGNNGQWNTDSTYIEDIDISGTVNGRDVATDGSKLDGIEDNATANDTDANLKNRANHTGSQAISTVTGLQSALDSKLEDVDIADINATGTAGGTTYLRGDGTWSTPAGGGGAVDSVNGQTGAVTLDADDIDDTSTTNKFVTSADLTTLSNTSGTNTGDQDLSTYQLKPSEGAFVNGDKTKLDGIEALAEVNTVDSVNTKTGAVELIDSDLPVAGVADSDLTNVVNTIIYLATLAGKDSIVGNMDSVREFLWGLAFAFGQVNTTVAGKADASHSHVVADTTGLQTALNAKLESSDITDFETTTELNARDTANRARANHTGTQAISTVTNLQSSLDAKLNLSGGTMTGALLLPAGSASAPALSRSTSTDDGIYFPADGMVSISTNGSEAMRIKDGRIGLAGKTNPTNGYIYIGNGTGGLTDRSGSGPMAFKGKLDSGVAGESPSDGIQMNLNLLEGVGTGNATAILGQVDINDNMSTPQSANSDTVGLWGAVWVRTSTTRPTWGANLLSRILPGVTMTQAAIGAEINIRNDGVNENSGGPLSINTNGDNDVRFAVLIRNGGGGGTFKHTLLAPKTISGVDRGPSDNFIYYGETTNANVPTGSVAFQVDKDGNTGIKALADTDYSLNISGNHKTDGDIEITDATKGIIMKSPNGTRFRVTVADDGSLTTTGL